jgi:hypothetical protein
MIAPATTTTSGIPTARTAQRAAVADQRSSGIRCDECAVLELDRGDERVLQGRE